MRRIAGILFMLMYASCSTGTQVTVDARDGAAVVDVTAEMASPDLLESPDLASDARDVVEMMLFDVADLFVEPGCAPGDGCFLDPCTENSQCQSGWCVEHLGDGVCTQQCQDECPPGWSCKQVAGSDPDLVFVCASMHANLCKPCQDGNDCLSPAGVADVCVDYGEEGSFCGGSCSADDDCPWGFSCVASATVDGVGTTQCLADAGVCPCTEKSVSLGLWTPCGVSNDAGVCIGKRVCQDGGLTACDAAIATSEVCNGLDDDCDGAVDEPADVRGNFVPLCDDGNECTEDNCLGEDGCQHIDLTGVECKDGDICTVADHCVDGVCAGDPVICDDQNPCTDNLCTENGGCEYLPNVADCDDLDPCTVADECFAGQCSGTPIDCDCKVDVDCLALEDGDLCNGTLICDVSVLPHQCKVDPESVVSCPEAEGPDAICLQAACAPATGACSVVPDHEAAACDDGDPCSMGDTCQAGSCTAGVAVNCNDGNQCTDDSCAPESGCVNSPNAVACDDGDLCSLGDHCQAGECVSGEGLLSCDDGNPCTQDICVAGVGCTYQADDAACDDGDACTLGDYCAGGKCLFAALAQCDDGNPCTLDICVPGAGCQYSPSLAVCDDGNPCTIGDQCSNGACQGTGMLLCDDNNLCTDDFCDAQAGCKHIPNTVPCDDQNACTVGDACQAGVCSPGAAAQCNDGDVCTTDACAPETGCVYLLGDAPCNDGNLCTTNDFCHLGECIGAGELVCDDGSDCTADSCQPEVGCQFTVVTSPCCTGGTKACGESCANTLSDPSHCGDCDQPCQAGEVCLGGLCKATCGPSQTKCGELCTDLDFDPDHCGGCGDACSASDNAAAVCAGGECAQLCMPGYADCNLNLDGDGCEVHLPTDADHCGICAKVCGEVANGNRGCVDGGCVVAGCEGSWRNCDGTYNNGCETNTATNSQHCGGCDAPCGEGFVCLESACVEQQTNFIVLAQKDIIYKNIEYKLLKVGFASFQSQSDNWCYEYRNLCESYGYHPTGCSSQWNSTFYKVCRDTYGSVTYDSSLSCNPSSQIAQAAQANGFGDANGNNSFGYHYCDSTCAKTLCSGTSCHTALSYIDATKSHGYTLCIK